MKRILILLALLLAACVPQVAEEDMTYEQVLQEVQEKLPASRYMTNDYLPDAKWEPRCEDELTPLKIGFGWIFNDEFTAWYVADKFGWFQEQCISPIFVEGGASAYPLQLLAGGAYDVAVPSGGYTIPEMWASKTGAQPIAVGAQLKGTPYGWLGIDWDTPQDEVSPKRFNVQPEDLVDATVGLQPNSFWYARFLEKKFGLPAHSIHEAKGGFLPDPLLAGTWDFYGAWIMNQPRLVENAGFKNWMFFALRDHGISGYAAVSTVMPDFLEEQPGLVRGYLAALTRGQQFILDHPEEAAEIAVEYAWKLGEYELNEDMALRRFELEKSFVTTGDGLPILHMDGARWDENLAVYVQYSQIELTHVP